jgi:hypothetical protein
VVLGCGALALVSALAAWRAVHAPAVLPLAPRAA